MSADKNNNDPSMEELLASIREIIADDVRQTKPADKKKPAKSLELEKKQEDKSPKSASVEEDIFLELTNKIDFDEPTEKKLDEDDRVHSRLRADATFEDECIIDQGVEEQFMEPVVEDTRPSFQSDLYKVQTMEETSKDTVSQSQNLEQFLENKTIEETTKALEGLNVIMKNGAEDIQSGKMGSKTVEELIKEMLRPMLKTWLDSHLPSLVKWVVTEQVEKILQSRNR